MHVRASASAAAGSATHVFPVSAFRAAGTTLSADGTYESGSILRFTTFSYGGGQAQPFSAMVDSEGDAILVEDAEVEARHPRALFPALKSMRKGHPLNALRTASLAVQVQ